MQINILSTMFTAMAHSVAGGAIVMIVFVGIISYMKYSAGKDRTRSGYGRL